MEIHILNLLNQQYVSDKNILKAAGYAKEVGLSDSYWEAFNQISVNNWNIALDLLGFPMEETESVSVLRARLFAHYMDTVFEAVLETEEEVTQALLAHISWLYEQLYVLHTGSKPEIARELWRLN